MARPTGTAARARPAGIVGLVGLALVLLLAACGASTPKIDAASARAGIDHAYRTLFDFTSKDVAPKVAVIEHGASLRGALTQALDSPLASAAAGARVDSVTLLGDSVCSRVPLGTPCAKVVYDLLGPSGAALFPSASTGYAVLAGGKWLVAKTTICSLLGLFYSASGRSGTPPGC